MITEKHFAPLLKAILQGGTIAQQHINDMWWYVAPDNLWAFAMESPIFQTSFGRDNDMLSRLIRYYWNGRLEELDLTDTVRDARKYRCVELVDGEGRIVLVQEKLLKPFPAAKYTYGHILGEFTDVVYCTNRGSGRLEGIMCGVRQPKEAKSENQI